MPWEVLTGFATAPGGTLTALTMAAGDSLTVRKTEQPKLLNAWAKTRAGGTLRIRSVLMHDAVQGLRLAVAGGAAGSVGHVAPLMAKGLYQPLQSQDVLTVELSGSATALDDEIAVLMMHYDVLPGSQGRYVDEAECRSRAVQPFIVENTLALADIAGAASVYSGSEAINAEFDQFKAETDYALVGLLVQPPANEPAVIGWRGPDTANLRVGAPGESDEQGENSDFFLSMSRAYGLSLAPVFNAANKAATTLDGAQDEDGLDPTVSSLMMQLTPEAEKGAAESEGPTSRAVVGEGRSIGPVVRQPIGVRRTARALLGQ